MTEILYRDIHPEVKVLDDAQGLVQYVASDESLDGHNEIILADGWKFRRMKKNAPFLDAHNTYSIGAVLGSIVDWEVKNGKLLETVKWAIDVEENELARLGFKMTKAGHLKAVSVGFIPITTLSQWNMTPEQWEATLAKMNLGKAKPDRIFAEQEQIELSAVVIGSNPNAVARSFAAGVLTEKDLEFISAVTTKRESASGPRVPAEDLEARQRARFQFMLRLAKRKWS